jgi:DNA invertase Pin-like site-specific DNA recombinase
MADAHRRRFDVVVVWKFDRFARSVSHLLRALETFTPLGISFVRLSEQMDTTTPAGKIVFTVLGAVCRARAQFDRGTCEGWPAERPSQRETAWPPTEVRGYRKGCQAACAGPRLEKDCEADGFGVGTVMRVGHSAR